MSNILCKWFKSPNPALNVVRHQEDVTTDTVYGNVPAIDNGATMAQFFCGTTTGICDVYPMNTKKQFPDTLEDNIRHRYAMKRLLSDHAAVETSTRVKDFFRALLIGDWQSEAYMHHQNPTERRWHDVKRHVNTLLDRTGSPDNCWLLATQYVCFVLNQLVTPSLQHRVPLHLLTGSTPNISILLQFTWYEPVYWRVEDAPFPECSRECRGYFVAFAENVGHALTYQVLTLDDRKILDRSAIRSALNPFDPNLCLDIFDGETAKEFIRSKHDTNKASNNSVSKIQDNKRSTEMGSTSMGSNTNSPYRNDNGTLCMAPIKYIERMVDN